MPLRRLDGWKAIAAHLNRSMRQCQRLAESSNLPVHHLPNSRAVFSYEYELDAWLAGAEAPVQADVEARISSSGHHIILPVELAGTTPAAPEFDRSPVVEDGAPVSHTRSAGWRVATAATILSAALVLLAFGLHFHAASKWRNQGTPLNGTWTFANGGVDGRTQGVGRFDTGHLVGPGTTVFVTLASYGTRWSGGLEIFHDDLHWTFVSISPREHQILVQRFPVGTVTAYSMGSLVEPARPVQLRLAVTKSTLEIGCCDRRVLRLPMDPWDVLSGRLFLRVGTQGDETHDPAGGSCSFRDLQVQGEPAKLPPDGVYEVPVQQRPAADYTLTVDNIDDQIDVLIDGRRLASTGYRETIGPMSITPFLTRGHHTITALLFNRKWTAAYAIRLQENGVVLWNERCGDVRKIQSGCQETGNRLGMVKELRYTFETR